MQGEGLELGMQARLLAQFVGGDAVDSAMAFDRHDLDTIGVNRVPGPFAQQGEVVLFKYRTKSRRLTDIQASTASCSMICRGLGIGFCSWR